MFTLLTAAVLCRSMNVYRQLIIFILVACAVAFVALPRAKLFARWRSPASIRMSRETSTVRRGDGYGDRSGDAGVPVLFARSTVRDQMDKEQQEIGELKLEISAVKYLLVRRNKASNAPADIFDAVSMYEDDDRPTLRSTLTALREQLKSLVASSSQCTASSERQLNLLKRPNFMLHILSSPLRPSQCLYQLQSCQRFPRCGPLS